MDLIVNQKSTTPSEVINSESSEIKDLRELKVGAGSSVFFTDKEGSRWGNINFDQAKAYIKIDGSYKFKASDGSILMDSNATDGNFINIINSALNTSSKKILTDFTFESTDYAGAFKSGNPTWDESTGLITGGSGIIINARGILGANDGTATFTLDATTGNATFAGTLSAPSGTLGTITAGTITGATIQNSATGYRCVMNSSVGYQLYNGTTYLGKIGADATGSFVLDSLDNFYFRDQTTELTRITGDGITIPNAKAYMISAGARMRYTGGYLYFDGATGGSVGTKFEGSVLPHADNAEDLGSGTNRWRNIYAEDITIDDLIIDSDGSITVGGTSVGSSANDDSYAFVTSLNRTGADYTEYQYEFKYRVLNIKMGIITSVGGESDWQSIN